MTEFGWNAGAQIIPCMDSFAVFRLSQRHFLSLMQRGRLLRGHTGHMQDTKTKSSSNRVLDPAFRVSQNFFESDRILRGYLEKHLPFMALAYMTPKLEQLGRRAAQEMDALSLAADQNSPELLKRDRFGETIDEIRFHPAYAQLMGYAVDSEMMRVKWEPGLRQQFGQQGHALGFAAGYLFAMGESGQYCPLCMTDGVARLIDRFAGEEDRDRLLPRIYTDLAADFYTGAMFLTEKAGGSDVGANLVRAEHVKDRWYRLSGEKWFCSNVNAEVIFALARTDAAVPGTKGLSIFLLEKEGPEGQRNPLGIVRLKDKLGTRSMASGECVLDGTWGKLVGEEFEGFRIMADMINLSRLYNSVAALAGGRRALAEAYQFLSFRHSFGKMAVEHSLVRAKFWELGALHLASFHLVWRTVRALDAADNGDAVAAELVRLLTPMAKRESAELAVYITRESMELMGGMGYIEDTVLPKIMRDVMVLPIWEGAGNIMVLDMLRAAAKSDGLAVLLEEIRNLTAGNGSQGETVARTALTVVEGLKGLAHAERDSAEFLGKKLFVELTRLYQIALVMGERTDANKERTDLALRWLMQPWDRCYQPQQPPSAAEIHVLLGWEF